MEDEKFHLRLADYMVFALTVLVSVAIGIYFAFSGGRQRTTSEFLLGGRKMTFVPVGFSLFVSFQSSIMMLGMPAEAYMYGLQIVVGFLPLALGHWLSAYIIVPLIHPLKITSGFEYLELRFKSRAVRLLGSSMNVLLDMWYMGMVLFGPAVALQAVTDFPLWVSVVGLALMAIIYTAIGGLKAVIWTDVFQAIVMFTGIFAVAIKGTITAGGIKEVWNLGTKGGRMNFFEFDLDPRVRHTFWKLTFCFTLNGFFEAFRQTSMQRICSTPTMKDAKRVIFMTVPAIVIVYSLAVYEGVVAYAYYAKKQCDPFASGQLQNPNQIIPYIVVDIFHSLTGMPGLFLASLFSASLSTLSSSLSSLSALLWSDFVHPVLGDIAEWKATLIAKASVVVCGTIACGLAGLISLVGGTLHQISVVFLSSISGPLFALFFLGAFFPRTTAKGVTIGGVLGVTLAMWISLGASFTPGLKTTPFLPPAPTDQCHQLPANVTSAPDNSTSSFVYTAFHEEMPANQSLSERHVDTTEGLEHLYTLSYLLNGMIGTLGTIFFGYVFSILTGVNKPGDVDPRYLLPVSDSLLVFLPKSMRRYISSKGTQFIHLKGLNGSTRNTPGIDTQPFLITDKSLVTSKTDV